MDPALAHRRPSSLGLVLAVVAGLGAYAAAQPAWPEVAAVFEERCVVCHAGEGAPLGVRLTDHAAVLAGGDDGPVVVPGDPDASELVRRIRGESLPRMPLTGPPFLDEAQIALVEAWVAAGAPGPGEGEAAGDAGEGAPVGDAGEGGGAEAAPAGDDAPPADAPSADGEGLFGAVAAIFAGRCVTCHAPEGALGAPPEGLMLISHGTAVAGGERVVVVPGAPLASELYRRVTGMARPRMPLDGPPYLDEAQIEAIRTWIEAGAPDGDGTPAPVPGGGEVRLHGTLSGEWELDGLPLVVGGDTRFDDEPAVGEYVEVRGVVRADGAVEAERIRAR